MTADEYQQAARALARETTMSTDAATRIETELLAALISGHAKPARPLRERRLSPTVVHWAATAASVAVMVAALSMWRTAMLRGGSGAAVPPSPPAVQTLQAIASLPPPAVDGIALNSAHRTAPRPSRRKEAVTPSGFVALPWAMGLPAFESGEIVRMEVPMASLPAYGIDISSGADRPVEADILIGQDGLARAIRLVANTVRSTQ
jgi:hypothetical protein